ncbi:hypothetical protein [Pedobacter nyackensis]|uniref:Uncharacterized protein n=1 Tax=Pedobacter nyackensis TaxID=475255 RepID=A0A1W2DIW8_9SPHI|nr:hypothetical protein [Pedobacter nyackensis]SMC97395.1 hypothetical protein SAMN04488101_10761 [Pedobacter nyackensis]
MKVKLTPLNIVSALCLVVAVLLLLDKKDKGPQHIDVSGLLIGFCFLATVVAFISDQIFRRFIPSLKKLWIIEGVLIVFIIILIFIIKASII